MATKSSSYLPKHAYPALMNVFPDSLDWVLVNTHVFDHIQLTFLDSLHSI